MEGIITEYTNMQDENIQHAENYKEGEANVFTLKNEEQYYSYKRDVENFHNMNYDSSMYNTSYVNDTTVVYNDTNYCNTFSDDTYHKCNTDAITYEPEQQQNTTASFRSSGYEHKKTENETMDNDQVLIKKNVCDQWQKTNSKDQNAAVYYYTQDSYTFDEKNLNEDIKENNFIINSVNINDLYNSETENETPVSKKKQNNEDLLNGTYKKKNAALNFFYNLLKKNPKKRKKKKKQQLKKTDKEKKSNSYFYNDKTNIKCERPNQFLYEDSCITFENTKSVKEANQTQREQQLKYKPVKYTDTIDIQEENMQNEKIENEKRKNKNKISMNLFNDMQSNESVNKWKNKFHLMQNVAPDEKKKKGVHVLVFVVFLFLNIFINYDSGILPVSLNKITKDFNLSVTLQGLIGAMPYIGLTLASFFLGTLLQKYEQKKIILKSMVLNILNISITFLCTNKYLLLFLRFIYGITHSVLIIYIPVWADEYAPSLNLTFWLGLIHISTIIGITIGYLCTGLLIIFDYSWMYSLIIQAFFLFLFSLFLFGIPKRFINISNMSKNQNISSLSKYTMFDTDTIDDICFTEKETEDGDEEDKSTYFEKMHYITDTNIDMLAKHSPTTCVSPNNSSASTRTTELCDNNTIIIYVSNSSDTIENLDKFNDCADKQMSRIVAKLIEDNDFFQNEKLGVFQNILHRIKKTYVISSMIVILRCPLYMWLVFALCNLFFVVIGIFFWSTKFFTNYLNIGSLEAMFYFIGTSLTAPVIGILMGSKIVDKFIGGYKEYQSRLKTLYFCIFNSCLTSLMALMVCIFDNYKLTLFFTWTILLFGAMLLPPITGIILSTVKSERRSFASAFSMFFYNIFGYALGTFFPGFIVDFFDVSEVISIKVVYLWSFFGLFNLCIATFFAKRKKKS